MGQRDPATTGAVAIDRGTAGLGRPGADPADPALSHAVAGELRASGGADFAERLRASYLRGLRDAGWDGDARLARLGYAATAALAGAQRLHWTLERALGDDRRAALAGTPWPETGDVLRRWAALTGGFRALGEEAQSCPPPRHRGALGPPD